MSVPKGSILSFAERAEAAERARKRAEDKIEEREHLRLELKAREYIQVCHTVIDKLLVGEETVKAIDGSEERVPLDRARVQALKSAMDGSLRLLDRVLPPLKAVEVSDSLEKQADPTRLTTSELHQLIKKMGKRAPVTIEQKEPPPPPWMD